MSKPRSRNSLMSTHAKASPSVSTPDELASMKYHLDKPSGQIYPLESISKDELDQIKRKKGLELTYPDFHPWIDHTQMEEDASKKELDKMTNSLYLNKGLFEAPQVSNEYYTARNLIQATLFSSGENCFEVLKELSQHISSVYQTRNEVINKIRFDSNNFKLPARVTLTTLKRDAWLKDLADPTVPLSKISLRIPHGIKNKVLIGVLCSKMVPITRAIWFTKCVSYGDQAALRKKFQTKGVAESEAYEVQWLQEWTQQVVDYVYRFSREFPTVANPEKKQDIMQKLNYLLKYVQTLYIECLVDRTAFLASIIRFFKEGLNLETSYIMNLLTNKSESEEEEGQNLKEQDINVGQRLVALLLHKVFWNDLIKHDYVCKELSEALLLNYYFISRIPIFNPKLTKVGSMERSLSSKLKESILNQISDSVRFLFKLNTNAFIIPTYWILISGCLYDIMLTSPSISKQEIEDTQKQLQLVQHRNESLMLNMKTTKAKEEVPNTMVNLHRRTGSFPAGFTPSQFESMVSPDVKQVDQDSMDGDIFINRSSNDIFRTIDYLDKLKFNDELVKVLRPTWKQNLQTDWKLNLLIAIMWCISSRRDPGVSCENILMFCGFIKHKMIVSNTQKGLVKVKATMENGLFETIFSLFEIKDLQFNHASLFVLINELYQLKLITIATYLRKLIASGLFFMSGDATLLSPTMKIHLSILKNLPVLNNKQCDNILKKWSPDKIDFNANFKAGQEVLQQEVIDKFKTNTLISCQLDYLNNLEVGIKFLLVNWMTNELKSIIVGSPRLIHIRIISVALLYKVYSACDNLAVFFKVIVKKILANEGKVIMLDMDSLYLISKLIIRHFKLIKTISGSDSGSVGFDLIRQVMFNYRDLATREPAYLDFKSVWEFVDKSFDTRPVDNTTPEPKIQKPATVPQFIFSKATIDSPMKLESLTVENNKNIEEYFIVDFSTELNELLEQPYVYMTQDEINETLTSLKLSDNGDIYSGENGNKRLAVVLFDYYMRFGERISPQDESSIVRLLVNTKNVLIAEYHFPFTECFSYFIQKQTDKLEDEKIRHKLMVVSEKLISNSVLGMLDVVHLITTGLIALEARKNYYNLLFDIVIGDDSCESELLSAAETLLLNLDRHTFHIKSGSKVLEIVAFELKRALSDENEETNSESLNPRVKDIFEKWILNRSRSFVSKVKTFLDEDQLINVINRLSVTSSPINLSDDLMECSTEINEFNLPIFQILIRLILVKELINLTEFERVRKLDSIVRTMITRFKFQFSMDNSFVGEIFNLLPQDYKSDLLQTFTCILVENLKFEDETLSAKCYFNGRDILPLLTDLFKKFSVAPLESSDSAAVVLGDLSKYLTRLFQILAQGTAEKPVDSVSINRSLSTFMRIIIIHKESIAKYLATNPSSLEFLNNMKALILSDYLADNNEKLRILLYDLMLIFKNLITVELSHGLCKPKDLTGTPTNGNLQANEKNEFTPDFPDSSFSEKLENVFNLPQIDNHDILRKYMTTKIEPAIALNESEIRYSGDYQIFNHSNLHLVKSSRDSVFLSNEPFNILGEKKVTAPPAFKIKSFEILENTGSDLNNGRINLLLFDAYVTKQNPP